jgi:hypothetical protein
MGFLVSNEKEKEKVEEELTKGEKEKLIQAMIDTYSPDYSAPYKFKDSDTVYITDGDTHEIYGKLGVNGHEFLTESVVKFITEQGCYSEIRRGAIVLPDRLKVSLDLKLN